MGFCFFSTIKMFCVTSSYIVSFTITSLTKESTSFFSLHLHLVRNWLMPAKTNTDIMYTNWKLLSKFSSYCYIDVTRIECGTFCIKNTYSVIDPWSFPIPPLSTLFLLCCGSRHDNYFSIRFFVPKNRMLFFGINVYTSHIFNKYP